MRFWRKMMPVTKVKNKERDFESALDELEKIVRFLESEDLKLDESIKKFEEGLGIVRFCSKKLDDAQKKIDILLKDKDGKSVLKPFEPDEDN